MTIFTVMQEEHQFEFRNIEIRPTFKTPYINLNKDEGVIELRGLSIPENTSEFYWHFNRWLSEYCSSPAPKTTVVMAIRYMNSSSSVVITKMMTMLDESIALKSEVTIEWYYEVGDDEMLELGKLYDQMLKCPVNLHELEKL